MLVSLKWLNERVDLSNLSTEQIDELLTFAGIEVEGIQAKGAKTDSIVVAQIVSAEPHPDADKLKVCMVDHGAKEQRQIVCGAQNYKVGDKVPCALPGSDLGGGFVIKEGKLRGVESKGMLCSASEIGYIDQVDGLMILPEDAPVGKPVRELLETDTIFEVEITPNRPDLLSHSGMGRELAALAKSEFQAVDFQPLKTTAAKQVTLQTDRCPYYTATRIRGVQVGPSPDWLQEKLVAIDLRPINNVVDITNYVLHELGQPLHAFDAAKVSGGIVVRQGNSGESFDALIEETYELTEDDVVISDESGAALCIGGVMGGIDSGVTENTKDVILEAAWFNPTSIRATARRLVLTSDSSYRFERGADGSQTLDAAALAAHWIVELTGGTIEGPTEVAGAAPAGPADIAFDEAALQRVAGDVVPWNDAVEILTGLGIQQSSPGVWSIPPGRWDLTRAVDLAEEAVRVFGLDKFPSQNRATLVPRSKVDDHYDAELGIKRELVGLGFFESQTIKLIGEDQIADLLPPKLIQDGDLIRVSLPLSTDHAIMRPSLIPGLVETAARNARQGAKSIRFFETGTCFRNAGGGKAKDLESQHLGLIMGGPKTPECWADKSPADVDLYDLKAVIQSLAPAAMVQLMDREREGFFLASDIMLDGKNVGVAAMMTPARSRELDCTSSLFVAELDLVKLLAARGARQQVDPLQQFPGSTRDLALELSATTTAADVEAAIKKANEALLVEYQCIDLFSDPTGEKLSADKKSMAYRFLYRSSAKTLKGKEVDKAHQAVVDSLTKALNASVR